jgi:hypothetical protein
MIVVNVFRYFCFHIMPAQRISVVVYEYVLYVPRTLTFAKSPVSGESSLHGKGVRNECGWLCVESVQFLFQNFAPPSPAFSWEVSDEALSSMGENICSFFRMSRCKLSSMYATGDFSLSISFFSSLPTSSSLFGLFSPLKSGLAFADCFVVRFAAWSCILRRWALFV